MLFWRYASATAVLQPSDTPPDDSGFADEDPAQPSSFRIARRSAASVFSTERPQLRSQMPTNPSATFLLGVLARLAGFPLHWRHPRRNSRKCPLPHFETRSGLAGGQAPLASSRPGCLIDLHIFRKETPEDYINLMRSLTSSHQRRFPQHVRSTEPVNRAKAVTIVTASCRDSLMVICIRLPEARKGPHNVPQGRPSPCGSLPHRFLLDPTLESGRPCGR